MLLPSLIFFFAGLLHSHPQNPPTPNPETHDLSLPHLTTASNASLTLPPIGAVTCFDDTQGVPSYPTAVESCRPTLRSLTTFPAYRSRQTFFIGPTRRYPRLPYPPPYHLSAATDSCKIDVYSSKDGVVALFSFQDVKKLATEILQHCVDYGQGKGGVSRIGEMSVRQQSEYWIVAVRGKEPGGGGATGTASGVAAAAAAATGLWGGGVDVA